MAFPIAQEEQIFEKALEFETKTERDAYVVQACGEDEELRARVEELITALEAADKIEFFHDQGTGIGDVAGENMALNVDSPERENELQEVGAYQILRRIGEGGCGDVYLAEQREPVHRRVALKVIKRGMDSRQVLSRFDAERQALAMMEHPNIAKLHDAGMTDDGRPYFVMELVSGPPITRYCDANQMSVEDRVRIFFGVCEAVQHAHEKGIVHRDLKPANVMVTASGSLVAPRVIDFGIAKATQARLTRDTIVTEQGQIVGTPSYMSPEQIDLQDTVDERSDVYSLGALLYELLAGTAPFDIEKLRSAGVDSIRRILCEEVPPSLSACIGKFSLKVKENIARARSLAPNTLESKLRGDLDCVLIKALEKDPLRRYQSVAELMEDLRRYLAGEPVLASHPSAWRLLHRWVLRHRLAVAMAVGIAVGVLAVATLWRPEAIPQLAFQPPNPEETVAPEVVQEMSASLHGAAEDAFSAGDQRQGMAFLALVLRWDKDNKVAAARLYRELSGTHEWADRLHSFEFQLSEPITSLALASGRSSVMGVTAGGEFGLWSLKRGRVEIAGASITTHPYPNRGFTADGRCLVGPATGGIGIWDSMTGSPMQAGELLAQPGGRWVSSHPSAQRLLLVLLTGDQPLRVFDPIKQQVIWQPADMTRHIMVGRDYTVDSIVSTENGRFYLWAIENRIQIWDVENADPAPSELVLNAPEMRAFASAGANEAFVMMSSDGGTILCRAPKAIQFFDLSTRQSLSSPIPCDRTIHIRQLSGGRFVSWEPPEDGKLLVRLWNRGKEMKRLEYDAADALNFSPSGWLVLKQLPDQSNLEVVDLESGVRIAEIDGEGEKIEIWGFSPDESRLLVLQGAGELETQLRVVDLTTGTEVTASTERGILFRFSPDGERLLAYHVHGSKRFEVFDARTLRRLGTVAELGEDEGVFSGPPQFLHDRRTLVHLTVDEAGKTGQSTGRIVGRDSSLPSIPLDETAEPSVLPEGETVPEWLPDLVEAAIGKRVLVAGQSEPVGVAQRQDVIERLGILDGGDAWSDLAHWMARRKALRSHGPKQPDLFSNIDERAKISEDIEELREIIQVTPENRLAFRRLGSLMMGKLAAQPESVRGLFRRSAQWYVDQGESKLR